MYQKIYENDLNVTKNNEMCVNFLLCISSLQKKIHQTKIHKLFRIQ